MAIGALTRSQLTEVEPGIYLATRAARAYRRAKADFRAHGDALDIVGRFAAYRDKDLQNAMSDASHTTRGSAARARYNLSSSSTVGLARHPNGSHEDGRTFDLLINGSSSYPNAERRARLRKHGWIFQFGSDDPNHVRHNNINSILPVTRAWCIKHHIWVRPKAKQ